MISALTVICLMANPFTSTCQYSLSRPSCTFLFAFPLGHCLHPYTQEVSLVKSLDLMSTAQGFQGKGCLHVSPRVEELRMSSCIVTIDKKELGPMMQKQRATMEIL